MGFSVTYVRVATAKVMAVLSTGFRTISLSERTCCARYPRDRGRSSGLCQHNRQNWHRARGCCLPLRQVYKWVPGTTLTDSLCSGHFDGTRGTRLITWQLHKRGENCTRHKDTAQLMWRLQRRGENCTRHKDIAQSMWRLLSREPPS